MAATEAAFDVEMVELRKQKATWDRRISQAILKISALHEQAEAAAVELAAPAAADPAPAPDPLEGVAPIAGGGHYEPSAEDWAEYRAYCEEARGAGVRGVHGAGASPRRPGGTSDAIDDQSPRA